MLKACSGVSPIAVNTCDGAASPVEQAEPADAQILFLYNYNNNSIESLSLYVTFIFPVSLFYLSSFIFTSFILFFNLLIK